MSTADITAKASLLFEARTEHERLKKLQAEAYSEYQRCERELVEAMLGEQLQNFEFANGIKVSIREEFSLHVNKDNEFQVTQWLTETQGDLRQFVKEALHKPSIVALIKTKVESGELPREQVPAFFGLNTYPSLQIRGWNSNER